MEIQKFKSELKSIYTKYSEFIKAIDNYNQKYLEFLYCHTNENIKIELSKEERKNKISKKINFNKKYYESLLLLYKQFFTKNEIELLSSTDDFYVNIYEENYDERGSSEYFTQKNRRDFLIPSFLHDKTIEFLNSVYLEDTTNYHSNLKDFFILLGNIRKNISTKNRLGTIIASSISLQAHNLRISKDLDTVILHPKNDQEEVAKKLREMASNLDFMDPYIDNIFDEWEGIDKNNMYLIDQIIEKQKFNFFDLIFNPNFHYYFYGIKLIDLDYDLKYRAKRRFPKNVADLIMVKIKLKKDVPKILPLEERIIMKTEWEGKEIVNDYTKYQFIDKVRKYLYRFNITMDHDQVEKEINLISEF